MAVAVGPEVLKRTQAELGKYIKKPPLTDKLLSKPPFRFLHDVINAVITETGFLAGLFTDDELSSQNIKDKDAKIEFLQKCIDATVLATGENITVRPGKIVAGHEADKTNEWLQALGRAVAKKTDSSEAVSQVLSGVKPQVAKKAEKKTTEKQKDKPDKERKGGTTTGSRTPKKNPTSPRSRPTPTRTPTRAPTNPPSSQDRKPPSPATKSKTKLAVEDKNVPLNKSPRRGATTTNTTTTTTTRASNLKGSKGKDEKEKSTRKPKSKSKEEESKGSSKETKERKVKTSSSSAAAAQGKEKPAKSRPASRANQVREKENSPPHEVKTTPEPLTNGHEEPEEMASAAPTTKSVPSRPPSARHGSRTATGKRSEIPNGGSVPDEEEVNSPKPAVFGDQEENHDQQNEPSTPPTTTTTTTNENNNNDNNNIDPAILKAMSPHHADHLQGLEPPDSGVGSLESPKHPPNKEQDAPPMVPTPRPPTTKAAPPTAPTPRPGPQPLRAMEQFPEGADPEATQHMESPATQITEPPPPPPTQDGPIRPRTGRRSARPPSARPAPPKVRERREVPKEEIQRPGTAKPVANVILPSDTPDADDDDDNFVVEESKPVVAVEEDALPLDASSASAVSAAAAAAAAEDGQGAGLLVAQILETKKEMEDGRRNAFSPETPGHRRVPIEQTLLSDANRKKEREVIQKDVQKLSGSIQSITRSVNPLAKMLDYLQEDLDSMQKELESWQNENKILTQTLKQEQSSTDQALEPLSYQLMELETTVQEQRDRLSAVKSNILRNNEKIGRLMSGINLNI